jgi:hypothetical protein
LNEIKNNIEKINSPNIIPLKIKEIKIVYQKNIAFHVNILANLSLKPNNLK